MKKVLFTIQSYPSQRSANVLCDDKIIQALLKTEKYEVHCLVCQYHNQPLYEEIDGIKVHRFNKSLFWRFFTWAREHEGTKRATVIFKINRFSLRLKQIVTIPIYPCYEPFCAKRFAKKAIKLHKKEQFDLVISEYNGFETLYAGYRMKKNFSKLKYIPIFWDSLSGGFNAKYLPDRYCKHKKTVLEADIFNVCDHAIIMMPHKEHIDKRWITAPFYKRLFFLNIPYLVHDSVKINKDTFLDSDKTNAVFAGSLGTRNPDYIIQLFQIMNRLDIVLWFICDISYQKKIQDIIGDKTTNIKFHRYIPNDDLKLVLQQADILVNIGVKNTNAISGKIFEYMAFGKPIISTYFIDNEACLSYLKRYPLSLLLDERKKDLHSQSKYLEVFIDSNKEKTISFELIKEDFRQNTPEAYVELIDKIMENQQDE
jgi:glycosyltransferase involved in cell wall biosynthesis